MSLTISPARIVEESGSPLLAARDGWERRPLGEVATILNGFAFKSKQFVSEGGKPLIRIRDIFNERTAVGYVGDYETRYLVQPGELLVGMDGDFNCARWRGPEGLLNQRVCKITPDPEQLDLHFLRHLLPGYLQAIHDLTSSTTVTHLSSRDVAQIPIPVPPLEEQRGLTRLLEAAASKRQSSTKHLVSARHAINRFRQAILAAACSGRLTADWRADHTETASVKQALSEQRDRGKKRASREQPVDLELPALPDSYLIATVGDAATRVEYGTSKRADGEFEQGIPVLRMGNIQDGALDLSDLKYIVVDSEIEGLLLDDGDLLFNRTNSPELVGKSAVYRGEGPVSFASYLIRVRLHPEIAEPDFVNYWITSAWGRIWARLAKTDGVSQSNINGSKLALMPIPLPPIEEQKVIVERAGQLLEMADGLEQRVQSASSRVERSSQAVLAKAFRGDLMPLALTNG